ncbi:MAG TPA: hypothetical protein VFM15_03235 [Gammaproteobacteria bacterium]|nr:hypothetical protein [Gammaproteobacteria bacterium]
MRFASSMTALAALGLGLMLPLTAKAGDYIVYSPHVAAGQSEVEFRGHRFDDGDAALSGEYSYQFSVAHAFTSWWKPEIYLGEYAHTPGGGQYLKAREFENTFQLTEPGEYWADVGFLAAWEFKTQPGQSDEIEFGPLFERRDGRMVQRLNLIWERGIGSGAEREFEFRGAYSLSYQWRQTFAPGIEIYALPEDNAYQLGPVFYGELASSRGNEFEYSAGLLAGINKSAPDLTLVLRLEYEFF